MQVATLQARVMAAVVDSVVVVAGMAVVGGIIVGGTMAYERVAGSADGSGGSAGSPRGSSDGDDGAADHDGRLSRMRRRAVELITSPRGQVAFRGAIAGLGIASRNWRSPGDRVAGLRRVDARTGGPVSVRSALAGQLFNQAVQAVPKPFVASRMQQGRDRVAVQVKAIEDEYPDDPKARQQAIRDLYQATGVKQLGCGWVLASLALTQLVLALAIRNRRTAYDRVTGTIVICD